MQELVTFYLPVFALCAALCEGAMWLFVRERYVTQAVLALLLAALLSAAWLWVESPSFAFEQRPFASTAVVAWMVAVPVALLSIVSLALVKLSRAGWRHFGVVIFCAVLVGVYPLFVLLSVCWSGIDCI